MRPLARAASILFSAGLLLGATVRAQTTFRAPESIKIGLSVMSQVVENTARSIDAKRYDQLAAESDEFEAAVTALQQGIGKPPPPQLEKSMEPLLARARIASSAMSEAAASHRDSMLPVAHAQFADAVRSVIALFPESLRPEPSSAQPSR